MNFLQHKVSQKFPAWSPDGQRIASVSADQTVHVWRPDSAAQLYIYAHRGGTVHAIARSDDSHRLVSVYDDKTVRIWEGV
jgi:WD40 repeat protein